MNPGSGKLECVCMGPKSLWIKASAKYLTFTCLRSTSIFSTSVFSMPKHSTNHNKQPNRNQVQMFVWLGQMHWKVPCLFYAWQKDKQRPLTFVLNYLKFTHQ